MNTSTPDTTRPRLDVAKFIRFHKKRIAFLKDLAAKGDDPKLVVQVSFLGFESLAKRFFPEERNPGERFIALLSTRNLGVGNAEAIKLYVDWRTALFHEGFIVHPFTTLEGWDKDSPIVFPEGFKQSTEFPPESIIALYDILVEHFQQVVKERNIDMIYL